MRKSLNFDAKSLQNTGGGISQTLANRTFHAMRFAALFLFLFFIGVGNTWGQYYKVRLQAVYESGSSNGQFFACAYEDPNRNTYFSNPNAITGWKTDVFEVVLERDSYGLDVDFWAKTTDDAPFFVSWYKDPECTEDFTFNDRHGNQFGTKYSHYSTPEEAASAEPVLIMYARFSKSAPKTFYFRCVSLSDTESPKRGSVNYAYTGNCLVTDKIDNQNRTAYNGETSYDRSFDIGSYPFRGYRFTEWTIVSGEASYIEGFDKYQAKSRINITSTSNSSSSPTIVQVRANYEALSKKTLTVQKDKSKGSVTANYANIIPVTGKAWYKMQTTNLTAFALDETERTYTDMYSSDKVTLIATAATGYQFKGWYTVNAQGIKTWLSSNATLVLENWEEDTYYAHFGVELADDDLFVVGENGCKTFAQALAIATSSPTNKTILVREDCTIPAGNYTIPKGVTLVVPYDANQGGETPSITRISTNAVPTGAYRTLTLADGVHLNVYGAIEVSGTQTAGTLNAVGNVGHGRPGAPTYGLMVMNSGSSITLNNGAVFRAWGYVTGQGEIDARRGAVVKEQFQLMDWKGLTATQKMWEDGNDERYRVLPVNQYYIQNIEVPTTYHPGAKLLAGSSVSTSYMGMSVGVVAIDDVGIIGVYRTETDKDAAIFLLNNEDDSEDTWVRKYYDATTDQQVYEVNNSAYLGSLVMKIKVLGLTLKMDSRIYTLPITNNFKIHLLSGDLQITQNTTMLPGSEIEVNKKSILTINEDQTLYLYDADQWGQYVFASAGVFGYASEVKYRPGDPASLYHRTLTPAGLGDAKLTVHGTVNVEGQLMTTESGAAITSSISDAGAVTFSAAAPIFSEDDKVWQLSSTTPTYVAAQCVSGLLTNDAGGSYGAFSQTAGAAAGKSFCFIDMDGDEKGEWVCMTDDGCFSHDQNGVYYIKPQAYLPISVGEPEEKADHTYRDEYGNTGKIFINIFENNNCQWWEVETVAGNPELFHCTHPQNDTYYHWYVNPLDPANTNTWQEKKFRVEFRNWNDTTLKFVNAEGETKDHYELPYNSYPQWLSANPTRNDDANFTYTFDGWYPEITSSTKITGDMVFMAKFKTTPRQYFITFKNAEGGTIEISQYAYGTTPTAPVVDMTNKKWSPAIGTVTGNQIYQLVAATSTYTVIWKNWDGTTILETDANVTSGTPTAYNSATPTKAADQLNSYEFAGWSPTPAATVTADAIYTATFNTVAQTYAIRFFQEDGSTPIGDPQNLAYGTMPEVPEYSKAATAAKTYTLVWSPLVSAATKDQDYVATFTEQPRQYTVTWKNGEDVIETNYVNYGTTPVYSGVTPTDGDASTSFNGWTPTPAPVTGNQVYTAQFTTDILTISNGKTADENETVGGTSVTTVIISKSGTIDLSAAGSKLEAENLILESDGSTASGQLIAENGQINADHIYFDYKVNAKNHKWYGVAVPWQVDAEHGISVNGRELELGKDFDIVYYNGALRAEVGKQKCWSYVEAGEALQPGRLYMIGLMMDAPTIRFEKESGANILTTTTSVTAHSGAAASTDQGWNGVANPALFHAYINPGVTAGQVYNPEKNSYDPILMNDAKFVVGQGAFVEVEEDKAITVTYGGAYAAPRRARAEEAPLYDVRIAPAEGNYTDRLFVRVEDEKEADTYVIGKDLAKLGVSKSVAQMWINRYNTELCLNTMTMENGAAEYPLGIFAPHAGEYTIYINSAHAEYDMYLTFNGEAIWNLSEGAYTGTFDAGTTSAYGLRISARAPQITTGIDEAVVDAKGETRKVMIDNQVFIIRGENVYSVDGQLVK